MVSKTQIAAGTLGLVAALFLLTRGEGPSDGPVDQGKQAVPSESIGAAESSPAIAEATTVEISSPSARAEVESDLDEAPAQELSPEQRKIYLRAGLHKEVGITGDVMEELDALAESDLNNLWAKSTEKRAAGVLGLKAWKELETAAALAAESRSASLPEIESLMAEALSVADQIHDAASESMSSGFKFEKWWENSEHDSERWRVENGVDGLRGELGFSSGASVGGRNYNVYFDSYDFPHIDSAIKSLRQRIEGLEIGVR